MEQFIKWKKHSGFWFNSYAPNSYPWFITVINHGYRCFIS